MYYVKKVLLSPLYTRRTQPRPANGAEPGTAHHRSGVDQPERRQCRAQSEEDMRQVAAPAQHQPAATRRNRQPRQVRQQRPEQPSGADRGEVERQAPVRDDVARPAAGKRTADHPNIATLDELYQHLGGHLLWQKLRELEKVLQRRGVRFSLLQNERLSAELVSQYLSVKKRQLL